MDDHLKTELLDMTTGIVTAHVSNNAIAISDIGVLIANVHGALSTIAAGDSAAKAAVPELVPAVPVRQSIKPDYIVCLEDGKKLKMLKRHLMTHYQLTPDEYRAKWSLPRDYPMVSPNYSEARRGLALKTGLGRKAA